MRFIKTSICLSFIVWSVAAFQATAQEVDTTQVRFSEETERPAASKNVKWVRMGRTFNTDSVGAMWKIGMSPLLTIVDLASYRDFTSLLSVGYERKISKAHISAELRLTGLISTRNSLYDWEYREFDLDENSSTVRDVRHYAQLDLLIRHYPFKKRRIVNQKGGDNLWGFYVSGSAFNLLAWGRQTKSEYAITDRVTLMRVTEINGLTARSAGWALGVGYQQRFLNRGFVDLGFGYSKSFIHQSDWFLGMYLEVNVGYSIFKVK